MNAPQRTIKTEVTATMAELTELFGEPPTGDVVQCCEGEWRLNGDDWRWFKLADL